MTDVPTKIQLARNFLWGLYRRIENTIYDDPEVVEAVLTSDRKLQALEDKTRERKATR